MSIKRETGLKKPVDPDNPNYYLDKTQMRDALREHRDACLAAEAEGKDTPPVSDYLGECFLNIAKGLAMKHNFRDYSFIQDMIMDGVMTCLKNIRSYDPDMISERTGTLVSPLSYFTQVCFWAFVNRLKKEEDQAAVKWSMFLDMDVNAYTNDADDEGDFQMNMAEWMSKLGPQKLLEKREKERKIKEPKKQPPSPLDDILE